MRPELNGEEVGTINQLMHGRRIPILRTPTPSFQNRMEESAVSSFTLMNSQPNEVFDPHAEADVTHELSGVDDSRPLKMLGVFNPGFHLEQKVAHRFHSLSFSRTLDFTRLNSDRLPKNPTTFAAACEFIEERGFKSVMEIREMTEFEQIEYKYSHSFVKAILNLKGAWSQLCRLVISNAVFETMILLVIMCNIVTLAMEDPEETDPLLEEIGRIFLWVYTVEAILKIGGLGLTGKCSYFTDYWNILDFCIVVAGWLELWLIEGVNLTAMRILRILRPLRSISSIQGLKVLFLVLLSSIKSLLGSIAVLLFFFLLFAIAGLQLFRGLLTFRCLNVAGGQLDPDELCGNTECSLDSRCAQGLENPNYGVTNFDNILSSMLAVFQCVTLEGWSTIMDMIQVTFSYYTVFYFVPLVFVGAFLMLNLTLAIIKFNFTKVMDSYRQEKESLYLHETENEEDNERQYTHAAVLEQYLDSPLRQSSRHVSLAQSLSTSRKAKRVPTGKVKSPEPKAIQQLETAGLQGTSIRMHSIAQIAVVRKPKLDLTLLSDPGSPQDSAKEDSFGKLDERTPLRSPSLFEKIAPTGRKVSGSDIKRLRSTVSASRGLLRRMMTSSFSGKVSVVMIPSRGNLQMPSFDDVLPPEEFSSNGGYLPQAFLYFDKQASDNEVAALLNNDPEPEVTDTQLFKALCRKMPADEAFFTLHIPASEGVQHISEVDRRIGAVIGIYSGEDVAGSVEHVGQLNSMNFILWPKGVQGTCRKIMTPFEALVTSKYFSMVMTFIIVCNTVALALEHHGISAELETVLNDLNYWFTIIFLGEMCLKLLGLGPWRYFKDLMNYLDTAVVAISVVELMLLSDTSALTAFRTLRIFRSFRVLRVARLFRYLRSLSLIVKVLAASASKFIYLALFLLLFIMMFALLGMQLFGGRFDFEDGVPRANFDSFHWAFVTVFQILTLENWQSVLYSAMRSTNPACALYFVSWIFIGNFVLLNLFLAILLDSFHEIGAEPDNKKVRDLKVMDLHGNISQREKRLMKYLSRDESEDNSFDIELRRTLTKDLARVDAKRSFCIFSKRSHIRRACFKISQSRHFENTIMIVILLSNIKLAWDTYLLNEPEDSKLLEASSSLDVAFTVMFTLEMLIKAISLGFACGGNSYLSSNWNRLDFVIVSISLAELALASDLTVIKVFRSLRTLRPLRLISHNVSMKIIVTALLESIFAIFNVLVVLLIVWLMFAILGVSLFGGKLYSCTNPQLYTEEECTAYDFEWVRATSNFDNVVQATVTLFIVSSLEGWPEIMYQAVDADEAGTAPILNNNPVAAYYFIVFILIGVFLFLNLFIGVVFEKFEKAKKVQGSIFGGLLNKEQEYWVEMLRLIAGAKPSMSYTKKPRQGVRHTLYRIAKSSQFDVFIIICIVLNMIQMAILFENAPKSYTQALEYVNLVFTCIFLIECGIKLIGLSPSRYFRQNSNKFDFAIVLCSLIDFILGVMLDGTIRFLRTGPQLARVIRVLRISRLVRIAKVLRPIQDLFNVLKSSLPPVLNVLSLLLLIFFIYDILGVYSFSQVSPGVILSERTNFRDFGQTMVTLLRICTGEDWHLLMHDCMKETAPVGTAIYFISFVAISSFIILNLFTMVIVQVHENYSSNPEIVYKVFNHQLKHFSKIWKKFAAKSFGEKVHARHLVKFIYALGPELGVSPETSMHAVQCILASLEVPIFNDYVHFLDLFYAVLKHKYGRLRSTDALSMRLVRTEEKLVLERLERLRAKGSRSVLSLSRSELFKDSTFFVSQLFVRKIFTSWKEYVLRRSQKDISISSESSFSVEEREPVFYRTRPRIGPYS